MQHKNEKTDLLKTQFGKTVRQYRLKNTSSSLNGFAYANEIGKGNMSRIENGLVDTKLSSLWKISEGFNIPLSKLIKMLEKDLPKGFKILDV